MKTILVPTDFSENAANALKYAAALANHVKGEMIIAHVINLPVTSLESGVALPSDARLEEDCRQELDRLSKELRLENGFRFDVETICEYGFLTASLNELVKTRSADLVVMGTKGATNFLDALIGTNTSDFIKIAACPVLAIPAGARFTGMKTIAYASDFESEENIFLQQLFQFAGPFQSYVSIINILTASQSQDLSENAVVRDILEHFPDQDYCIVQIKEKEVIEGIHEFVKQKHPDVLAISIHERGFFEALFHKSVSRQLVYHATLPLLTLPEKPYKESLLKTETPTKKSIPVK
jgi:nucleotide-binding universal stress UspA family protein